MSAALAPAFLVAALVLCLAGLAKLRVPGPAALALSVPTAVVRALALGELALGAVCVLHPTRATGLLLALAYQVFAVVAVILMRRGVPCGCFGDNDLPVSPAHVIASELLAALALAAALSGPRGLGWVLDQAPAQAVVLVAGVAGAVYATALVYTLLPAAWKAWSAP